MKLFRIEGEGKFIFSKEDEKRLSGRCNNWSRPLRWVKYWLADRRLVLPGERTVGGNKVMWEK